MAVADMIYPSLIAAILLIFDLQANWHAFDVEGILACERLSANEIAGICVELASMYVMLELLIAGIWVKRLRKKMKE